MTGRLKRVYLRVLELVERGMRRGNNLICDPLIYGEGEMNKTKSNPSHRIPLTSLMAFPDAKPLANRSSSYIVARTEGSLVCEYNGALESNFTSFFIIFILLKL